MMGVLAPTLPRTSCAFATGGPTTPLSQPQRKGPGGFVSGDGSGRSRLRQTAAAISVRRRIALAQVLQRFERDARLLG